MFTESENLGGKTCLSGSAPKALRSFTSGLLSKEQLIWNGKLGLNIGRLGKDKKHRITMQCSRQTARRFQRCSVAGDSVACFKVTAAVCGWIQNVKQRFKRFHQGSIYPFFNSSKSKRERRRNRRRIRLSGICYGIEGEAPRLTDVILPFLKMIMIYSGNG